MKKILCLIDALSLGGAERQIVGLASLLKDASYDVSLAYYIRQDFYLKLAEDNNVRTVFLPASNTIWSKISKVKEHIVKEKYDIVIAYKDGPSILSCILKFMGYKFRLIVSERNTTQVLSLRERIKFLSYRYADQIVPNSYSQNKFIEMHYPRLKNKTLTITNFTDIFSFVPNTNAENHIPVILTAGRIAAQKNVLLYIDAISLLKKEGFIFKVRWIGNVQKGEELYEMLCREKIKEFGLSDCFEFISASNNILNEYQKCDCFCLPSIYEGYPNVICEAMSCGKPILCGNICDNVIIVKDTINGFLFDPHNVEDMVLKFMSFFRMSPQSRLDMGYNSRRLAENLFSPNTFVNKYIDLIES